MRISNMTSSNGNKVANQFIILTNNGCRWFQSYDTMIARIDTKGKVSLDKDSWDYSVTTGKYRNQFLGENKAQTQKKIDSGEYVLTNLN